MWYRLLEVRGGPVPVVGMITVAVDEQQRRGVRVAPVEVVQPEPLGEVRVRRRARHPGSLARRNPGAEAQPRPSTAHAVTATSVVSRRASSGGTGGTAQDASRVERRRSEDQLQVWTATTASAAFASRLGGVLHLGRRGVSPATGLGGRDGLESEGEPAVGIPALLECSRRPCAPADNRVLQSQSQLSATGVYPGYPH